MVHTQNTSKHSNMLSTKLWSWWDSSTFLWIMLKKICKIILKVRKRSRNSNNLWFVHKISFKKPVQFHIAYFILMYIRDVARRFQVVHVSQLFKSIVEHKDVLLRGPFFNFLRTTLFTAKEFENFSVSYILREINWQF